MNDLIAASATQTIKSGLYLCLFSDGTLKVGRGNNVRSRLKTIESAGECFGISAIKSFHVFCYETCKAELRLIQWCEESCTKQFCREWFRGINFNECKLEAEIIALEFSTDEIKANIDEKSNAITNLLCPPSLTDEIYSATRAKLLQESYVNNEVISAFDLLHKASEKIRSGILCGCNPPEWFQDLNADSPFMQEMSPCFPCWELEFLHLDVLSKPDYFRKCAEAMECLSS